MAEGSVYGSPADLRVVRSRGESEDEALEREGIERLAACRIWKSLWDLDLREAYFFATPQRQRQVQSYSKPPQQRLLDAAELNTDFAFEICGDFATEVINTYMPEASQWCERGPGEVLSLDDFARIEKDVRAADAKIFTAIRASNLYAELSKAFDPDLAVGTVAMWIERPHPMSPIWASAIPIREFEINLGPDGNIDDRFAIRYTRNAYVRKLLGNGIWEKVPAELKANIVGKPATLTELRWGFWRLWDDHSDECWQHVVYVGKELVHSAVIKGEGCCPLLVFRWNPNPDWPWGHGPLLQYLPSLRQVDEQELMRSEHAELSIRPPFAYPDDSFAAIEQGLEPGMGYPIRPGSEGAIKPIYLPPPPEAANYAYEEKEKRLRKGFYVDFPQQSGDTPPTLGQWLDEMARAQRRIGRPGLPFFREGPAQIFIRYKYLMERSGAVQPIKIDGRTISLMPYNPAQRAAEQQEIAMAVHGLQLCGQFFPEEFKMWIDGKATMDNLLGKLRVELVKMRDPQQVQQAVDKISQLAGGQPPGGIIKGPAPPQPGTAGLPQ
jgi:Bacteriophage head to tail connecting protein